MDKIKILEQLKSFKTDESKAIWLLSQVEQIEKDFEMAQNKIEDKCQSLISDFFSETLDLPKEINRLAQIGVRHESFIDRFKSKIILDEGIVSGEAKELLQTAKAEILNLRSNIRKAANSTSDIKREMQIMERKIYLHEQIELLKTDKQKQKVKSLCENANSKYKIDIIMRQVKKDAKK